MAIDMDPQVGRIVLVRAVSTEVFPFFTEGGRITKVSGARVYYRKDGKETFTQGYAAICDKQEEADKLLKFTEKARAEYAALHKKLIAERIKLHPAAYYEGEYAPEKNPKEVAQPDEEAPRKRRVRA